MANSRHGVLSRWAMAAFLVLVMAPPANSGTIFSNFGPGDTYGPDGIGIGAIPVPGYFLYAATPFSPAGADYRLTGLELPLAVVSGPLEADVFLMGDLGGAPSGVIEAFHLTGFAPAGPLTLVSIPSVLNPVLASGTQYWVAATGGTPTTFAIWALTLFAGDPSAGGASRAIIFGEDAGWTVYSGARTGAVRVSGDAVPEPACFLLTAAGCGFLGAAVVRRRRARAGRSIPG